MNDSVELIVSEPPLNAAVILAEGGVRKLLDGIRAKVRAYTPDVSTKAGRDDCASVAYKVARSKTAVDDLLKEHVAKIKKEAGEVDAHRRTIREELDMLRDEVRKPLDDYEAAIAEHEAQIVKIIGFATFDVATPSTTLIRLRIDALDANPKREWGEFADRASEAYETVGRKLDEMFAEATRREAAADELEQLRKEKADREAAAEKEAAIERARVLAEAKVAADLKAAAERAEKDRAALEKAEADRVAAVAQAKIDKAAAVDAALVAERAAKRAAQEEADRRAADREHRKTVNTAILSALIDTCMAGYENRTDEERARVRAAMTAASMKIIVAIVKGEIPNTRIQY